jgi:tetratricopeptide (TPR) repeat protein
MASDEHPQEGKKMAREPLPEPKRKRLEKVFEVASKKAAAAATPSDFDYVADLLTQCVLGELGNATYIQAYLDNLQKKYGNNRKGSRLAKFKERGARSAQKKALAAEQWDEVIRQGLEILPINPWDTTTLVAMATAANKTGDRDCELVFIMGALKGTPKDPECNRLMAIAMADRGQIDKAITYWHRVEEVLPDNEEAKRTIASLTVQKARSSGKFDEDDDFTRRQKLKTQQQVEATHEQRLLKKIQDDPNTLAPYLELAQLFMSEDRYKDANQLWAKAFELSDGDNDVREKWEDCQLRYLRQKITKAQDPETRKKLEMAFFEKDMEFYRGRVERYPSNLNYRYELGYRYLKIKRFAEAIQELQTAKNDPRRKGVCLLALGECFRQIKQYKLAMDHYNNAIREIPDRDTDNRKRAHYLAGRLALGLGNLDAAEKHLGALAALDFTYKDVSKLLDKVAKLRQNPDSDKPKPPDDKKDQSEDPPQNA